MAFCANMQARGEIAAERTVEPCKHRNPDGASRQVLSFTGLTTFGRRKKSRGSGVFTNTEDSARFSGRFVCPDEPAG